MRRRRIGVTIAAMSDYVIVGSGPAGSAVAGRLSADRAVAGGGWQRSRPADPRMPAGMPLLFKSRHDWAFETTPQDRLDDRRVVFPRGKTLGGSSSIDADGQRLESSRASSASLAPRKPRSCSTHSLPSGSRKSAKLA
jgi:hypothetical protein